ncbi:hypothetical protein BC940DRAFT_287507 [Gongronella butleri]|nr:hypothetical protein BC940DRAFT_287507 [Gongronella butleri]
MALVTSLTLLWPPLPVFTLSFFSRPQTRAPRPFAPMFFLLFCTGTPVWQPV